MATSVTVASRRTTSDGDPETRFKRRCDDIPHELGIVWQNGMSACREREMGSLPWPCS